MVHMNIKTIDVNAKYKDSTNTVDLQMPAKMCIGSVYTDGTAEVLQNFSPNSIFTWF
jgi:hypothetical protein